jgi:hypothetical protein
MPDSEELRCSECNARLKFGRRAKARLRCPRCGHEFDYQPPAESLDPFIDEANVAAAEEAAEESAADSGGPVSEFGAVLQEITAPPAAVRSEVDFGDEITAAPLRQVEQLEEVNYGPPPTVRKRRQAAESALKHKPKRRKRRSWFRSDEIWLYLGGAGLFALFLFVCFVVFRPGAILGRSLTPEEVAGTYVSEINPKLKITFLPDKTWGFDEETEGGHVQIDGMVYSIKGRKIICDAPDELKARPGKRILLDTPLPLIPHRSPYERIAAEFGDLTFKNGTLVSMTKGRFTRVEALPEEP